MNIRKETVEKKPEQSTKYKDSILWSELMQSKQDKTGKSKDEGNSNVLKKKSEEDKKNNIISKSNTKLGKTSKENEKDQKNKKGNGVKAEFLELFKIPPSPSNSNVLDKNKLESTKKSEKFKERESSSNKTNFSSKNVRNASTITDELVCTNCHHVLKGSKEETHRRHTNNQNQNQNYNATAKDKKSSGFALDNKKNNHDKLRIEQNEEKSVTEMKMLRKLHAKIGLLKDPEKLQKVVDIVEKSGKDFWSIETGGATFDFDLCKLSLSTLKQLENAVLL